MTREADRDQQLLDVGQIAEVAARPLLDPGQAVVGGVDMDVEPLRRDLGVQVRSRVGEQRAGERPACGRVVFDEAPDGGRQQP